MGKIYLYDSREHKQILNNKVILENRVEEVRDESDENKNKQQK